MNDIKRTISGATLTSEGTIPHLYRKGILLPVKLDVQLGSIRETLDYQKPIRINGNLVYALPGGGWTV